MADFYPSLAPDAGAAVWREKPEGWYTPEEFLAANPAQAAEQPTLEEALTFAMDAITARRQQAEYGGVIVRGTLFPTEQKDELRLYALERKFAANAAHVETWKANGVWVDMDAALFAEYAAAFQNHIPACFATERQKTQGLAAASLQSAEAVTAWLAINLNTGWPGAEAAI